MKRISRSRKGDFNILLALIGTVIVGFFLLIIGYKIVMGGEDMSNDEKCRLSIFAADKASALRRESVESVSVVPAIDCKTKEIIIEPEDVKRGGRGKIDDDLVKGKFALALRDCWNIVGAGKLNPFQYAWPRKDVTFCMKCATIEFSDAFLKDAKWEPIEFNLPENYESNSDDFSNWADLEAATASAPAYNGDSYELHGLQYWLATRRIPLEEQTFYQYMYGRAPTIEELTKMKTAPEYYPLDKEYSVIWRFVRLDGKASLLALAINPVGAVMAGLMTGTLQDIYDGKRSLGRVWVYQGAYILQTDWLSGKITFGGGDAVDACTVMVN
ncbi:MAG: hypothetical protein V1729_04165 [Candidatus Woesearchaeota archaeon]